MKKNKKTKLLTFKKNHYQLNIIYQQNNLVYTYRKTFFDNYFWEKRLLLFKHLYPKAYKGKIFVKECGVKNAIKFINKIKSGEVPVNVELKNGNLVHLMEKNIIDIVCIRLKVEDIEFNFNDRQLKAIYINDKNNNIVIGLDSSVNVKDNGEKDSVQKDVDKKQP